MQTKVEGEEASRHVDGRGREKDTGLCEVLKYWRNPARTLRSDDCTEQFCANGLSAQEETKHVGIPIKSMESRKLIRCQ